MHRKCLLAAAPDFPSHLQGFTCIKRMKESCCSLSDTIWGHPWGEGFEEDEPHIWGFALMRWTRRKQLLAYTKLEIGRSKRKKKKEKKSAAWENWKQIRLCGLSTKWGRTDKRGGWNCQLFEFSFGNKHHEHG